MAARAIGHHEKVLDGVRAIGHGPEDRIRIAGVHIIGHGDDDLAALRLQGGGALQAAPDLRLDRLGGELQEDDGAQVGQGLVHDHAGETLDVQGLFEVLEIERLIGHLLHDAGFAGRDLADDGHQNRVAPVGDRRHPHGHVEFFQRDIAMALAEGAFGLDAIGVDEALHHDFRVRRHLEIDGDGAAGADGRA